MRKTTLFGLIITCLIVLVFAVFINQDKIASDLLKPIKILSSKALSFSEEPINSQPELAIEENKLGLPEKIPDFIEFSLSAESGLAIDSENGVTLFEKQANKTWPIASITKLVTALVFLDQNPDWEAIYQITQEDIQEGGKAYLFVGEKVKVRDLFYLSLVGSANTATVALVNSTGLTKEDFISEMNKKMTQLELVNTNFVDPTGLSNDNISTAAEVAIIVKTAFADQDISQASLTKKYEFSTENGRKKIVESTDDLLNIFPKNGLEILGGKTGYLDSSGYCFVAKFINQSGREIITVVLGAENKNDRFRETEKLIEWTYNSYNWQLDNETVE